jgi:iron complex transport system substrate-binding protein
MRGWALVAIGLIWSASVTAAQVTDATGRAVDVPDQITRIAPAGPPAAVLLAIVAPDLMVGWPGPVSDPARALLSPDAAKQKQIPRLTGREDVSDKIAALKPDVIIDYGDVSPRYADLATSTQQRTGIPTLLLNGALDKIPETVRLLGQILHRPDRANDVARFAEALLSLPRPDTHPTVVYARGPDGLTVAAGGDVTAVFDLLGWKILAPEGQGTFRKTSVDAIRALDPDRLVFADPAMLDTLAHDTAWQAVRAVQQGHAVVAPHLPFGWVEEPPSVNQLIGLAWLSGHDPVLLATFSNAVLYGHSLTPAERDDVLRGVVTIKP